MSRGGTPATGSGDDEDARGEPAAADENGTDATYSGVFGAFPYAYRASESRLFRSYVVLGGLLASLVGLLFGLGLVAVFGRTLGAGAGTFTFVRSFYVVVGLFAVAPMLAPVLLVARRHRRGHGDARYDAALAAAGYLVALSLYLGAVVTAPENLRDPPGGALAPLIAALYALPPLVGLLIPLSAGGLVYAVHRLLR